MTSALASHPKERRWWRPIAFSVGLALIIGVLYAIGYSAYESPEIRADRKQLARMATGEGVVFGSSHGKSILPEEVGFDGVNLSHNGQDAFEMVYMARAVKRAAPNLSLVIFTISYFSFAFDNAAYFNPQGIQDRLGLRVEMYAAFPSFGFIPGDAASYMKGLLAPVVTRDHWESVLWPGQLNQPASSNVGDLPPAANKRVRKATNKRLASHAKRRCGQFAELLRVMASNHPDLDKDVFSALRGVSEELEGAGIRVVLVTPPYFEAYNTCFYPKGQALARALSQRVSTETGAEYIDAGEDAEFTTNSKYFRDSDHLNAGGKLAFSRWLGRKVAGEARLTAPDR